MAAYNSAARTNTAATGRGGRIVLFVPDIVTPSRGYRVHVPAGACVSAPLPDLVGKLDADRLGALAALVGLGFETHLLAIIERRQPGRLERGNVQEDILAAIIWGDKAEAAGVVEEFDSTVLSHGGLNSYRSIVSYTHHTKSDRYEPRDALSSGNSVNGKIKESIFTAPRAA